MKQAVENYLEWCSSGRGLSVSIENRGDIGGGVGYTVANSKQQGSVSRSICYQMLEALGCSWEKQLKLFHTKLAQLKGSDRAIKLAELTVIEHGQLVDQATC